MRKVDDQVLTFRVSGKLWMRSLVMSDVETGTEWSHLLGRGMAGKLKGKVLEPIVTDMVTWSAWVEDYPETTVLDMARTSREFTSDFYRNPANFVFGFEVEGGAWMLSMKELIKKPVHSFHVGERALLATFDGEGTATRLFDGSVDGMELEFERLDDQTMRDSQTGSSWKITTGEAIDGPLQGTRLKQRVGIMSFRRAWENFHPTSKNVSF